MHAFPARFAGKLQHTDRKEDGRPVGAGQLMVVIVLDCLSRFGERGIDFLAGEQFLLGDCVANRGHGHDQALELQIGSIH